VDVYRRARPRRLLLVLTIVATVGGLMSPAAAVTPLIETDVAAFTSRADQWTQARLAFRENAHEQALTLAAVARQAEDDRLAAEEAERVAAAERKAAEEVARTSTTTSTTTTTTVAPATTVTAPDEPDPTPTTTTTTQAPAEGEPTAAQWEVLRQCESSGNYSIVSANGRYRGAYQFSQATWDWVAGVDHPSLVGVDPSTAAPGDQDTMALALWRLRGWSPWPVCGVRASNA